MNRYSKRNRDSGYSLVELIIVLTIFALISAVSATMITNLFGNLQNGKDFSEVDSRVRVAINRISRDLHRSTLIYGSATSMTLNTKGNDTIFSYDAASKSLKLTKGTVNQILTTDIEGAQFEYYDANGLGVLYSSAKYVVLNLDVAKDNIQYNIKIVVYLWAD